MEKKSMREDMDMAIKTEFLTYESDISDEMGSSLMNISKTIKNVRTIVKLFRKLSLQFCRVI